MSLQPTQAPIPAVMAERPGSERAAAQGRAFRRGGIAPFRRWAAVGSLALAPVVSACVDRGGPNGPDAQASVNQVSVTPKLVVVGVGDSVPFAAYGLRSPTDSILADVTWSATGGTVSPAGQFTAGPDTGRFRVTATHTQKLWLSDSATVDVRSSAPSVVQLSIQPRNPTLAVGDSLDFFATGVTATGDSVLVNVTWTATGGAIIPQGLGQARYTPGQVGTQWVVASVGQVRDSTPVTVGTASVASVSVSPAAATVSTGQAVQLTATPRDGAGNALAGRVVTWATSDAGVATVNGSGTVTGQAVGTATITATSEGQGGTATVTVSGVPVASVSVSPGTLSLAVAQTGQLTATTRDAANNVLTGRGVTWSANAPAVATVNASGVVTALGVGTATITATSEGQTGTATVTVTLAPVATVTVTPASPSMSIGQTVQLTATLKDAGGNTLTGRVVTWTTSAFGIATVSGAGLVSGLAVGTATITATAEGKSGAATVTVTAAPVATVAVSPGSLSLTVGQTGQLTAVPKDAAGNVLTGRVVTWTTSGSGVATVNGSGLVTAQGAGTATITATSEGKTGTATVTVTVVPVASVSVTPSSLSLTVGQTGQLTANPKDAGGNPLAGRTVTWTTSASGVATVSGTGLVTAQGAGSATITATSEGKSGTASVTVTSGSTGGTVLFQEGFEDTKWTSRGWYDNTAMTITTAEAKTGSSSMEVRWIVGGSNPTFGLGARRLFTASESVYLSYWVKYSTNWVGSGKAYHPHEFSFVTNEDDQYVGPAYTRLTIYIEDNYQNGGIPVLGMQDARNIDVTKVGQDLTGVTESRAAAGCNGNTDGYPTDCYPIGGGLYANAKTWTAAQPAFLPNPGPGYKNDWHFVEVYYQLNTIVNGVGQTNGIARYWVDGQLVIDHSNVLFRTGAHATMKFNQFLLSFYMESSPADQKMWVDDLTIATGKP